MCSKATRVCDGGLALVFTRMPFLCQAAADTTRPPASRKSSSAVSITCRFVTWSHCTKQSSQQTPEQRQQRLQCVCCAWIHSQHAFMLPAPQQKVAHHALLEQILQQRDEALPGAFLLPCGRRRCSRQHSAHRLRKCAAGMIDAACPDDSALSLGNNAAQAALGGGLHLPVNLPL